MAKAYSLDLRKRVIGSVEKGLTILATANRFEISTRVISKWIQRKRDEGVIDTRTGFQKGHSHKIVDYENFKKFVDKNNGCTLEELATKWTEENGVSISDTTIGRAMKKLGYSYKKKPLSKERSEQKRQEYTKLIEKENPDKLVYLDETGINDNEVYSYGWGPKGTTIYGE